MWDYFPRKQFISICLIFTPASHLNESSTPRAKQQPLSIDLLIFHCYPRVTSHFSQKPTSADINQTSVFKTRCGRGLTNDNVQEIPSPASYVFIGSFHSIKVGYDFFIFKNTGSQ